MKYSRIFIIAITTLCLSGILTFFLFSGLIISGSKAHAAFTPVYSTQINIQPTAETTQANSSSPTESPTRIPFPTNTPTAPETVAPTETVTPQPAPTSNRIPPVVQPTFLNTPGGSISISTPASLQTPSAPASTGKQIIVVISQQHLYAYENSQVVFDTIISSGSNNSTPLGSFTILDKETNAWSDPWGFWMPHWMGFAWMGYAENGFHSLPVLVDGSQIWGDQMGTQISGGCVVLRPEDALKLYEWAEIGTPVEIRP